MIDQIKEAEGYILVAVCTRSLEETNRSLDELTELLETAGGKALGRVIQNLDNPISSTYIGSGKMMEVNELALELKADGVICDDELTLTQIKNLNQSIEVKVLDRPLVILDIFAAHAKTGEGKLQVELAQLQYRKSRLTGYGNQLSRLGGGIGTRGPGEKKLEVDRRRIADRITHLRRELKDLEAHRNLIRKKRLESNQIMVALVGYTNAGKSTIFNLLTAENVLAQDKLFATLDATVRQFQLDKKDEILLTDTVGFIQKLPHQLVESFKSTLEEVLYADILIHVVDISNPNYENHMRVVYQTLDELGVKSKPIITVLNKQDKLENPLKVKDPRGNVAIPFSAYERQGVDELFVLIGQHVQSMRTYIEKVFSYAEMGELEKIRKYGKIVEERYENDGVYIRGYITKKEYV